MLIEGAISKTQHVTLDLFFLIKHALLKMS